MNDWPTTTPIPEGELLAYVSTRLEELDAWKPQDSTEANERIGAIRELALLVNHQFFPKETSGEACSEGNPATGDNGSSVGERTGAVAGNI